MSVKLLNKFRSLWAYRELTEQLIIRDIKLKYRRSYLGYLWSVLNPLMLMIVLMIVFSNIFRFDIPNYPLYLISGQVIFNFMVEATNSAVWSITGNSTLLKKTYVPKYIFTLSKVGSSLVNLLFSLGALCIVMLVTQASFTWSLLFFPVILLQLFIFCLGISLFLAAATVFFRDIQYLWGVCVSMWMYLTPIFYPASIIPEEYQGLYKGLNPMYWYLEQFRDIVLYAQIPAFNSILIGSSVALLMLVVGSWYFNKKQDEFILYI